MEYLVVEEAMEEDNLRLVREIELEERRRHRKPRVRREDRRLFITEIAKWPDYRFSRYFRMARTSFQKLCETLCCTVGEDVFQPHSDIFGGGLCSPLLAASTKKQGAISSCGGKLPGEIRVAIFLRILAGASYLDLMVIFQVVHDPIYRSFKMVCGWINRTFKFPLVAALEEENMDYFREVSSSFAGGASGGEFKGCIGALDGLAVRIKRPTLSRSLPNPGAYYCRKNFFALNVQAICDANKKISWMSSRHIGSCHDSVAFTDTMLYDLLVRKQEFLHANRLFIVGDSAYNLESFLLVPYNSRQTKPRSAEDAYNFYHSSCRIHIECAFGEIVMRFGLLWKTLQFDISFIGDILSAAFLLHNYIVDERGHGGDTRNYASAAAAPTAAPLDIDDVPMVTDNNEPRSSGRPSGSLPLSRERGKNLRESICTTLHGAKLTRPMQEGFKTNQYGMVYMEY